MWDYVGNKPFMFEMSAWNRASGQIRTFAEKEEEKLFWDVSKKNEVVTEFVFLFVYLHTEQN